MRRLLMPFVVLLVATGPAGAGELKLSMQNGRVTLVAENVSVRQILEEWSRVGSTRIVNADKLSGPPLNLRLEDVPEADALRTLLRSASGYLAAPRAGGPRSGASQFDRILILATSRPPAAAPAAPPPTVMPTPTPPTPDPATSPIEPEDEPEEVEDEPAPQQRPAMMPAAPFAQPQPPQGVQPVVPTGVPTAPQTLVRPGITPVPEPATAPPGGQVDPGRLPPQVPVPPQGADSEQRPRRRP